MPISACFSSMVTLMIEVVRRHADDVGVLHQIDAVRQQIAQRRLRQRIDVLGRELAVAHRHRRSVGDDVDRARRVIFETHLAGLLDVEIALGLAAVGPDLDEISDQRLQRRQIGAHLGGLRLLIGIEGRENIGGNIAARIGNHRIGRRRRRRAGRQRRLLRPMRSSGAPSRPFGAGFGIGTVCAVEVTTGSVAPIDGCRDQQRQRRMRDAQRRRIVRPFEFWISVQRVVLSACALLSWFRQKEVSFFREISCQFRRRPARSPAQKPPSSSSTRISRFPA